FRSSGGRVGISPLYESARIERSAGSQGSTRLSGGISLCYKAYMRKWMRDRLKRRKKADPKADDSKTSQAPLQPAYFEAREAATSEASEKEVVPSNEDQDEG